MQFLLGKGILVLIIFIDGYVEGEAFSRSIAVFQVPGALLVISVTKAHLRAQLQLASLPD